MGRAGGGIPSPGSAEASTYTESGICCSERTTSPSAAQRNAVARSAEAPRDARRCKPCRAMLGSLRRAGRGDKSGRRELQGAGGGRARWTACSAPPRLPLVRRAHLGSRKRSEWGGGEEGGEEGGKRGGEGGRRGRRIEDAPLSAAAAQPRLGGPGESGGPRREGGRRRAGGDSQTPVSLAGAERALPRPTHCGHRVLYNSAVSHRGRDSPARPGRSRSPRDPSRW